MRDFSLEVFFSKWEFAARHHLTVHALEDGSALVVRKRTFAMSKGLKLYPPLRKLAAGKKYTFPTAISGPDALE